MDQMLGHLEQTLRDQAASHERLLVLMQNKRQALRRADHDGLERFCDEENHAVQEIGEMEKRRLTLVADLTLALDPAAAKPLALVDLAERLDEPVRGRLLVLRQQLRDRMQQVRRETAVAKSAVDSLVAHMKGMVQTIGGAMTDVGVYGRTGRLPGSAMAFRTLSTTA